MENSKTHGLLTSGTPPKHSRQESQTYSSMVIEKTGKDEERKSIFKSKSIWALFKLFLASRFGLKLSEKLLEIISISDLVIESPSREFLIQLDGETNRISNQELQIKMHPTGLNVIIPNRTHLG